MTPPTPMCISSLWTHSQLCRLQLLCCHFQTPQCLVPGASWTVSVLLFHHPEHPVHTQEQALQERGHNHLFLNLVTAVNFVTAAFVWNLLSLTIEEVESTKINLKDILKHRNPYSNVITMTDNIKLLGSRNTNQCCTTAPSETSTEHPWWKPCVLNDTAFSVRLLCTTAIVNNYVFRTVHILTYDGAAAICLSICWFSCCSGSLVVLVPHSALVSKANQIVKKNRE